MAKRYTRYPPHTKNGGKHGDGAHSDTRRKTNRDTRRVYQDNHTLCERCGRYGNQVIMYTKWDVFFCSPRCLREFGELEGHEDTPTKDEE